MEKEKLYFYKARVTSVYDADTVRADIDLGFGIIKKNEKLRLYGIDAPEVRGHDIEKGRRSRDILRSMILDKDVILKTIKDRKGKYGRILCIIYIFNEEELNVNSWLISNGYAKLYRD